MDMKRVWLTISTGLICALILAPASQAAPRASAAGQAKAFAAKQCAAQLKRAPKVFKARYGRNRRAAVAACVRTSTRDLVTEVGAAVEDCASELVADPSGFLSSYGGGEGIFQAFPNCVRSKLGSEIQARIEAFVVAGRACLEEAKSDPEAFRDAYGRGDGPLAALGRCVDARLAAA